MAKRERTKFGGRPAGWKRIAFDVPEGMAAKFEAARERMPTGSVKLLGTAAIGTFLSLPEPTQEALYEWTHNNELRPDRIDYGRAISLLLQMMNDLRTSGPMIATESAPNRPPDDPATTHFVSRILDPEVTPPPGGKQSDRGGAKKKGTA